MRQLLTAVLLIGLSTATAFADAPPPKDAKPLSELLQSIEKTGDFGYFDEVEWEDSAWEVNYYTKIGTKKKMHIDPISGKQRS
jgi:hypothetical protein